MSSHDRANYEIIKLTSKLREQGWTNQELEDFMDLPKDAMEIEIRQYRKAINILKTIYLLGFNQLNKL
tara:strand:+ start:1735 stop:1938 length:204 start_codon:yes stop_codon:yes gene_type:complete